MITFYVNSDNFFLMGHAGKNWGPFTFINKKYKGDKGLLEHERTHWKQVLKNPLMGLFYLYSERYRLKYEVQAYAVQLSFCEDKTYALEKFGQLLSKNYNLKLSSAEATQRIKVFYLTKVAQ